METNSNETPAGEQPPELDNTASSGGEQPRGDETPSEEPANIADLSEDQLESILLGQASEESSATPASSPPAENAAPPNPDNPNSPSEQPGEGARGEEATNEPGSDDASQSKPKGPPERLSVRSLPASERQLMADAVELIRTAQAPTLAEALAQLGATPKETAKIEEVADPEGEGTGQPEATSEPVTDPEPTTPPEVTQIEDELKNLRDQRRTAKKEYDQDAEIDLTDQIEDKQAELIEARAQARIVATQQASFDTTVHQTIGEVKDRYPDSVEPDSEFSRRMSDAIDLATFRGDQVLNNPRYHMLLAEKVAASLGIQEGQPAPSGNNATPSGRPPAPPEARPIGEVAPGASGSTPLSPDQTAKMIDEANPEQLAAALGWGE